MISEQHCWDILNNNFKNKGFVHHQTESFDKFITTGISKIITEEPPIVIENHSKDEKESRNLLYKSYTITFSNVYIPKPTITEEDRTLRGIYPSEARQRDLTYDCPIYTTVTTCLEMDGLPPVIEKYNRIVIGRMPIMLRTSLCYLTHMTPRERIQAGECSKDEGGYFIVKGKERVLIPQLRGVYNVPKIIEQKPGDKYRYIAEIRSMSEETGHSALLKALIGSDNRTMVFSLPYIREYIPIGVVFKAFGYTDDEEIRDLIGLSCEQTEKYIRLILRDAYLCEEQSDGSQLYNTTTGNKDEWEALSHGKKEKWRALMTRKNALCYIGQYAQHTLKENEREDYARQVIEIELFPHMGLTATMKEKAYFLGFIVNKLLSTHTGLRKDDDRDDYLNKRVESSGVLCHELFRQLFKKYCTAIVNSIEKKKQIPDAMCIITRLPIITNGIRQNFGTGNWGVPKNSYIRTGVSQVLSRLSYGATLSHLRRVTIPIGKESKNSKIRQIHPSQIMYLCPAECFDPETMILMWNGSTKRAGDIQVGDILIDDMGNATRVKSICSGQKEMYDVIPDKNNFTIHRVTDNHILTLHIRNHKKITSVSGKHQVKFLDRDNLQFKKIYFDSFYEAKNFKDTLPLDDTIDLTIEVYLTLDAYTRTNLMLYKVEYIHWEYKAQLHPYIFGLWLGDVEGVNINYEIDPLIKAAVMANKHIPQEYLINDQEIRLAILAGLIDMDGLCIENTRAIRIYKGPVNTQLASDIYTLIMSLGFCCWWELNGLFFTGNNLYKIPTQLPNKVLCTPYDNLLNLDSKFTLRKAGVGPYVGWQLDDPRGRFCLGGGEVVHNTPEGQPIGIVLNLSLLTRISERIPTVLIREVVENCDNLISITAFDGPNDKIKVFLNGIILGMARDPHDLVKEINILRTIKLIPWDVSISYDDIDEEINIYSDEGRLLRPVFTVKENRLAITEADGIDWDILVEKNLIKYIDHNEINNAVVAFHPNELEKYHNDYCEIAPAMMLGVMASIIPFSDHSQSPRNCYQCLDPDELVLMGDGTKKSIKDIKVGDQVISVDPITCIQTTTKVINHYVKKTDKPMIKVITESGRTITCTNDHPLLTSKGWRQAKDARNVAIINNNFLNEYYKYCVYSTACGKSYLKFREWKRPTREYAVFVQIIERIPQTGTTIADITTESNNHSFIAGDSFCVHNSSMGKQAMSMFALSHLHRADTVTHVLAYPQKPLVSTKSADMMGFSEMPSGINVIVAIACYTGFNQEDSVIVNHSAIQRGLFWATTYRTFSEEEKKQGTYNIERIGIPPLAKRRKDINYSLLDENGIVRIRHPLWTDDAGKQHGGGNVYVENGDVIVGKILVQSSKSGSEELSDNSLVIKKGEEGYIDRIFSSITPNGYKLIKVVVRTLRIPEVGDKFASKNGQKGVCIQGESLVTLFSGISKKIKDLQTTDILWGYNIEGIAQDGIEQGGLQKATCSNVQYMGEKETLKITLITGQELILTPDHRILTKDGWKEAQHITKKDFITCNLPAPHDNIVQGDEEWSFNTSYTNHVAERVILKNRICPEKITVVLFSLNMKNPIERQRTLAFSRILGMILADGWICGYKKRDNKYRAGVALGTLVDVGVFIEDIRILLDGIKNNGKDIKFRDTARFYDSKSYAGSCYIYDLPTFLARIFASIPGITVGKRILKTPSWPTFLSDAPICILREFIGGLFGGDGCAPYITGVQIRCIEFGWKGLAENTESCLTHINILKDMLEKCGVTSSIDPIKQCNSYAKDGGKRIKYGLKLRRNAEFLDNIGFRYCMYKQCKLVAATSFWKMKDHIKNPLTGIKWLQHIDAYEWFVKGIHCIGRTDTAVPCYYLSVESIVPGVVEKVYDITVPNLSSFVANGMVVHNCLQGESLVTLFSGISKKIKDLETTDILWGYTPQGGAPNIEQGGLQKATCSNVQYMGEKETLKITLITGQELICTPDHKILTKDGWKEAQHITKEDFITCNLPAPHDNIVQGDEEWSYPIISTSKSPPMVLKLSLKNDVERKRTLAFARILGLYLANGWIYDKNEDYRTGVSLATQVDVSLLIEDVVTVIKDITVGGKPVLCQGKAIFNNSDKCTALDYVYVFPNFLTRILKSVPGIIVGKRLFTTPTWPSFLMDDAPVCILREFIGGLFGGDGKAPQIMESDISAVKFSWKGLVSHTEACITHIITLHDMLRKCGVSSTIAAIEKEGKKRIVYGLELQQDSEFLDNIGFRYDMNKQSKLASATTCWKIKSKNIEWLKLIGAYDWFSHWDHATTVVPCYYLPVESIVAGAVEKVYDITVPNLSSFVANGMVVHNCGAVYGQHDMPWTSSGIIPDIIMNPHALPSRMTINQLMESVLGKSCSLEGTFGDATPFTESSVNVVDDLCNRLEMNKYERTGREMIYNGMTGEPMGMVFIGPVYYQRLKHLVSDKIHARAQGPNATLTRQPLEGRSRDGGQGYNRLGRITKYLYGRSREKSNITIYEFVVNWMKTLLVYSRCQHIRPADMFGLVGNMSKLRGYLSKTMLKSAQRIKVVRSSVPSQYRNILVALVNY